MKVRLNSLFFYRKHRHYPIFPVTTLGNDTVERLDGIKFLRLYLDETITWSFQINHVVKLLSRLIAILYRLKCWLKRSSLLLIYKALVYPNITFCLSVLGSRNKTSLNKKLIRLLGGLGFRDHTGSYFNELITVLRSSIYLWVLLVYKWLSLDHVRDWFSFYENSAYNTRYYSPARYLIDPPIRTTLSRQCIVYLGRIPWNSLPLQLKTI